MAPKTGNAKKTDNKISIKFQPNKFKNKTNGGRGAKAGLAGGQVKKTPHGRLPPQARKSKEDFKKERAQKFQERQAARAEKQKELEEQRAKAKQEKEEKIRQYKKKRLERTKVLSKRTQRGQPLMKDRMNMLLKQIQEMKKNG